MLLATIFACNRYKRKMGVKPHDRPRFDRARLLTIEGTAIVSSCSIDFDVELILLKTNFYFMVHLKSENSVK